MLNSPRLSRCFQTGLIRSHASKDARSVESRQSEKDFFARSVRKLRKNSTESSDIDLAHCNYSPAAASPRSHFLLYLSRIVPASASTSITRNGRYEIETRKCYGHRLEIMSCALSRPGSPVRSRTRRRLPRRAPTADCLPNWFTSIWSAGSKYVQLLLAPAGYFPDLQARNSIAGEADLRLPIGGKRPTILGAGAQSAAMVLHRARIMSGGSCCELVKCSAVRAMPMSSKPKAT